MATLHDTILLYCESSLHAGAGQGTGSIDLPIQRERHTGFPKIEASSLRGAIREAFVHKLSKNGTESKPNDDHTFVATFGRDDTGDKRSALSIGDARLLFFPVRSWKGVFTWITCPFALRRYAKEVAMITCRPVDLRLAREPDDHEIVLPHDSKSGADGKVLLEEYLFTQVPHLGPEPQVTIDGKNPGDYFESHLRYTIDTREYGLTFPLWNGWALVSDDVFADFVQMYTEKITRNRINQKTGTTDKGGLFNEEYLPAESILYAYVGTNDEFAESNGKSAEELMQYFCQLPKIIQVGGDDNIGKGLLRTALMFYAPSLQKQEEEQ